MLSAVRRRSPSSHRAETLLRPLTAMAMIGGIALIPLAAAPPASAACTSSVPTTVTLAGSTYVVTTFSGAGSCTAWTVPAGVTTVDVLVVAGGGGGSGGGGGAGGMRSSSGLAISTPTVSVTVGAGGAGGNSASSQGVNGGDSRFDTVTADGGGGGGRGSQIPDADGLRGGSGGGASGNNGYHGGSFTAGQGNSGGNTTTSPLSAYQAGGGGGGAGGSGRDGEVNAAGFGFEAVGGGGGGGAVSTMSGSSVTYAGGGGAGAGDRGGSGGSGGGGNGVSSGSAGSGTDGLGGGGGGSGNGTGGQGGSGVVIVRYQSFLTPVLGPVTRASSGYSVPISNHDALLYTWTATSTAGSASVSGSGVVTVSGLAADASATVTVTSTRTGYANGTASTSGAALPAPAPPPPPPPAPSETPTPTPTPTPSASETATAETSSASPLPLPLPSPSPSRSPRPSASGSPEESSTPEPSRSPSASESASASESESASASVSPSASPSDSAVVVVPSDGPSAEPSDGSGPAPTPDAPQSNAVGPVVDSPLGPISTVNIFTDSAPIGPVLTVAMGVEVSQKAAGRTVTAGATLMLPGSLLEIVLRSDPVVIGSAVVGADGSASATGVIPEGLEPGQHTIEVRGTGADGMAVQSIGAFELDDQNVVTGLAPAGQTVEPVDPESPEMERALAAGAPLYDPTRYPAATAAIAVAAAAGATAIGASARGGAKRSGGGDSGESSDGGGEVAEVYDEDLESAEGEEPGWGDRSRTWSAPGTATVDRWLATAPVVTGVYARLPGRAMNDGVWNRAMFGSAGLSIWALGAVLGLISAISVGFGPFPPALPLLLAIVFVGMLDTVAGIAAWLVVAVGAVLTGQILVVSDLRGLMGLFVLYAALPLIASATRPLRRPISLEDPKEVFDRVADYLVVAILLMVMGTMLFSSINGMTGLELVSLDDVVIVQVVVVLAAWVRMGMEDIAMHLYPVRSAEVAPPEAPDVKTPLALASVAVRTLAFMFILTAYLELSLGTLIVGMLFALPQTLAIWYGDLPNSNFLFRYLPRGMLYWLFLSILGVFISAWILGRVTTPGSAAIDYALLVVPWAIVDTLYNFGVDGSDWKDGWAKRLVGIPIVAYTGGLLLGYVTFM